MQLSSDYRIFSTITLTLSALAATLTTPACGDVATLTAVKDNTLFEDINGVLAGGIGPRLFAGNTGQGDTNRDTRRTLIAFDVAGNVPAGSVINSVELSLVAAASAGGDSNITVHRMLADWGEGDTIPGGQNGGAGSTSEPGDATWLSNFFGTSLWTNAGGDFEATPSGSLLTDGLGLQTWSSTPGLVADVQSWLDDPAGNYGWILVGDETETRTAYSFESRENILGTAPSITIDFTPIPEPATCALAVFGTLCCIPLSRSRERYTNWGRTGKPLGSKLRVPTQLLLTSIFLQSLLMSTIALAANQTATTTPVIVGGDLPYQVTLERYDPEQTFARPSLHSFVAGEHDGQWVLIGGLSNGLHGFDIDRTSIAERFQNSDIWVIDPVAKTSWSRSIIPGVADSGLSVEQLLSLTSANAQAEQVGDRLYRTGGFGDNLVDDPTARDTFSDLTVFDLPGIVDWVKGGSGTAADHIRQVTDPLFKVTGGEMVAIGDKMHLIFGQDFFLPYLGGSINGIYTNQVRTLTIQDDGNTLSFTPIQTSGDAINNPEFRRRDLNVYPTLRNNGNIFEEGITVLSGVFTESRGAWTVPVEVDADGNATQIDYGNDALNTNGELDDAVSVFKQGMNNYHSAKLGLFSEASGEMHELLFGGITLQEYDPDDPAADENGFVTDSRLPNTNQISAVVRDADGFYEQHYLGEFPELFTDETDPMRMRFGSNAEFFLAGEIATFENGVIDFDALPHGDTTVGYVYGGIIANAPHVFNNPTALSSASGEIFSVVLTKAVPEPASIWLMAVVIIMTIVDGQRRRAE